MLEIIVGACNWRSPGGSECPVGAMPTLKSDAHSRSCLATRMENMRVALRGWDLYPDYAFSNSKQSDPFRSAT